jgi:hypothetical protein
LCLGFFPVPGEISGIIVNIFQAPEDARPFFPQFLSYFSRLSAAGVYYFIA